MSLWISGGRRAFQEAGGADAKALEQELAMNELGWGEGRSEGLTGAQILQRLGGQDEDCEFYSV